MTEATEARKQLRVILSALPQDRRASEQLIKAQLDRFFAEPVTVPEMREAILWNQSRGYIDFRFNADEERHEWFLTKSGFAKEGF